jgi:hypothetical protein
LPVFSFVLIGIWFLSFDQKKTDLAAVFWQVRGQLKRPQHELLECHGQLVRRFSEYRGHPAGDVPDPLSDEAEFTQQTTDLIGLRCPCFNPSLSYRCDAGTACCSTFLTSTNRMFGRRTASQIASVSAFNGCSIHPL